jgi:hypothetical protein
MASVHIKPGMMKKKSYGSGNSGSKKLCLFSYKLEKPWGQHKYYQTRSEDKGAARGALETLGVGVGSSSACVQKTMSH